MAQVHSLSRKTKETEPSTSPAKGELVAFPCVDLNTVVKTVAMLRRMDDQRVLDNFNQRRDAKG